MIDLDINFDLTVDRPKSTKFTFVVIVMTRIKLTLVLWKLDTGNDQMILFIRCMCSENKTMDDIILSFRLGHIGKPLCGETGPFQCMCHDKVVKERSIFLPYFVFFVDNSFFSSIIVTTCLSACRGRRTCETGSNS